MVLFCSDIDGTLLNSDRTLSRRTTAAITRVVEAGHSFVLCSSRMPASMRRLESLYGGGGVPMIAYNGGIVINSDASISLNVPMAAEDAVAIYEKCATLSLHASFYSADNWYAWGDDRWSAREISNTGVSPDKQSASDYYASGGMLEAPPHKVMCMGDAGHIDEVEAAFADSPLVVTYRSKDTYLEMANASCSKGDGIKAVAVELGADLADCVFFGDNYNDLPAFEVVGTAVAVSNAKQAVIDAATVVTARNHDDGVAVFLETWLDRNE